jgi:hypothetical protein
MQSLSTSSKSAPCGCVGNRNHFGKMVAPVNDNSTQASDNARGKDNNNGFILIKKGEGVYYVRYDIIFAKAGDVFFMPRKVPQNFNVESDEIIPFEATAGEFEKFFNQNFLPYMHKDTYIPERVPTREEIKHFANLSDTFR